jgi:hypothetical protein
MFLFDLICLKEFKIEFIRLFKHHHLRLLP